MGYDGTFLRLQMQFQIGEIDKSRCVSYFPTIVMKVKVTVQIGICTLLQIP